jgi:hypothetical protein
VYLDEYVAGQFAFYKADVTLGGQKAESGNLEDQGIHYQKLNRCFTTNRVRRKKYGRSMMGVANSLQRVVTAPVAVEQAVADRPQIMNQAGAEVQTARQARNYRPAVARYTHPAVAAAMAPIIYTDTRDVEPSVMTLGMDGTWPLSSSSNALLAVTKQYNGCGYFPPLCTINVTLYRRRDVHQTIERVDIGDADYFGGADLADGQAHNGLDVEFKAIELWYEIAQLASEEEIAKVTKNDLKYYFDVPVMRTNQLLTGVFFEQVKVVLPKGAKFVFLVFLKDVQIAVNARKHNYISTRYVFLPGLASLRCNLTGKEGIVVKDGLVGLGVTGGRRSTSLHAFHANLVRTGLTERSFDEWFPPWNAQALGHEQALPMDLTPYQDHFKADPINLIVQLKYDAGSLERWNLRTYALVQRCYTYSPKSQLWTWVDLV